MKKEEVCVHVKNRAQLRKVRVLLAKYNQDIDPSWCLFKILQIHQWFYLQLYCEDCWFFSEQDNLKKITINEFEQILKNEL